jgi:transposase-like protein
MESKQTLAYLPRQGQRIHYDRRLILKIVKEIEEGLPRQEATRTYGLGKTTLDGWMKKYGSANYHENLKRRQYKPLEKRRIVTAIEQGYMSIKEALVVYNIKNEKTIRTWLQQFKQEKVEICVETQLNVGKNKKVDTAGQTAALQKALQEAELKIKALNTLIDVAEEQLKIRIRKKSGARQS